MTNAELIEYLKKLPPTKPVALFWDGNPRGEIEGIVNDDSEIVLVGDWSIYRYPGRYQAYPESKIVFG
jgi:hypothetical protein